MNTSFVRSYLLGRQWAMEPKALREIAERVSLELGTLTTDGMRAAKGDPTPQIGETRVDEDGVAHIPIKGVLLKEVPCVFGRFDIAATSTVAARAAIEAALDDDEVKAISLDIDSPGGSLAGVQDLADTIHAVRGLKPIEASVSDMAASAAYWVASQADRVLANESALVGSIGVYSVMEDASGLYAQAGVRVHVIRSADLKGAGVEGDAITAEQLLDAQRVVDHAAEMFNAAVARGRGVDAATAKKLATGQVWFAGEARDLGLVDEVMTVKPKKQKEKAMEPKYTPEQRAETAEKEAARLRAETDAARAQLAAINANRREELLTKYSDRIAPAALTEMRAYGEHCGDDLASFERFLKNLPTVTRAGRASGVPETDPKTVERTLSGLASITTRAGVGGQAGADQVARWLGTSVEKIDAYDNVVGWYSDGTFQMKDGRVLSREQLNAEIAKAA